jgi:hypothetical protein
MQVSQYPVTGPWNLARQVMNIKKKTKQATEVL